jgi:hypothetical protein
MTVKGPAEQRPKARTIDSPWQCFSGVVLAGQKTSKRKDQTTGSGRARARGRQQEPLGTGWLAGREVGEVIHGGYKGS